MSTFQWASTKSKGVAVDEWLVRMMTPQWALCSSSISTWRPRRPVPRAFAERYIYVGKQSNGADGWWVDRVACHSLLTLATCSYLSGPSCHCNSRKGIWRQASFSEISRVLIKFSCLYIDLNLDKRNQAFFFVKKNKLLNLKWEGLGSWWCMALQLYARLRNRCRWLLPTIQYAVLKFSEVET